MRPPRRQFGAALALGSLALAAWIAAGLGAGERMLPAPCLFSEGELSTPLAALPALTPIAVVTPHPWSTIALLSAEGHLAPAPATLAEPGEARYAVVLLELWAPQAGWSEVGRDAHWVLAARRGVNGTAP